MKDLRRMARAFLVLALMLAWFVLVACGADERASMPEESQAADFRLDLGLIASDELDEVSGMALSWQHTGLLWLHNDSGDDPRLFAAGLDGAHLGEVLLAGAENRDWEDMAVGPGPEQGSSYLYIGEIGDNRAQYEQIRVYRIAEPSLGQLSASEAWSVSDVEVFNFTYPAGPRDAEALLVDPVTGDLYVISKREDRVGLYHAPAPHEDGSLRELTFLADLPLTQVTAADISRDGRGVLIKTYENVYYWEIREGESLAQSLSRGHDGELPYVGEPQGEAIGWDAGGSGYYTVSEERDGVEARLYAYPDVVPVD